MSEEIDFTKEPGLSPDKAFDDSENNVFQGKPLLPYSNLRKRMCSNMGLFMTQFFAGRDSELRQEAIDCLGEDASKEEIEEYIDDNGDAITIWPGYETDASMIVWACTVADKTVEKIWRNPKKADRMFTKWVANLPESGVYNSELISVFGRIMAQLNASQAEPEESKPGKKKKKSPGK